MITKENTPATIKNDLQHTDKNPNQLITVKLIRDETDKPTFFEQLPFKDLIFPLILAVIITIINRRTIKAEISKLTSETEKNKAEIAKIKSAYQPIVLNSLQIIQNQLFQDKINSLKDLIKSKSELFSVTQIYHEGDGLIEDEYDYFRNVYLNLSTNLVECLKKNALDNAGLFPSEIRDKFNKVVSLLYRAHDVQRMHFSKQSQDLPAGMQETLQNIDSEFDKLFDLIRYDLHFDNTFIHDFIKEYQKDLRHNI